MEMTQPLPSRHRDDCTGVAGEAHRVPAQPARHGFAEALRGAARVARSDPRMWGALNVLDHRGTAHAACARADASRMRPELDGRDDRRARGARSRRAPPPPDRPARARAARHDAAARPPKDAARSARRRICSAAERRGAYAAARAARAAPTRTSVSSSAAAADCSGVAAGTPGDDAESMSSPDGAGHSGDAQRLTHPRRAVAGSPRTARQTAWRCCATGTRRS